MQADQLTLPVMGKQAVGVGGGTRQQPRSEQVLAGRGQVLRTFRFHPGIAILTRTMYFARHEIVDVVFVMVRNGKGNRRQATGERGAGGRLALAIALCGVAASLPPPPP